MDALDFIVDRDQHMRPLEYDLSENFNKLLRYMQDIGVLGNVPTGVTSESEIVSISDAYPAPPRALDVYGKSTQAGTPTPDAPVPILSVDDLALVTRGKNLLPTLTEATTVNDVTFTPNPDGSVTIAGTATAATTVLLNNTASGGRIDNSGNTIGPTGLTLSGAPNGSSDTYCLRVNYYTNKTGGGSNHTSYVTSGTTLTRSNSSWHWVYIYLFVASGATVNATVYPQLEQGTSVTAYEPYIGTTIPDLLPEGTSLRSLPDGTRDQLNLSYLRPSTREGWAWYSKEVVAYTGETDLGTLTWTAYTISGKQIFRAPKTASSNIGICTSLACVTNGALTIADNCINPLSLYWNTNGHVMARADAYANAAAFQSGMTGQKLIYKLATPVTTTLDPIELPQLPAPTATVWCDGGSAQPTLVLEYVRDANAVVAELSEAIADIISG